MSEAEKAADLNPPTDVGSPMRVLDLDEDARANIYEGLEDIDADFSRRGIERGDDLISSLVEDRVSLSEVMEDEGRLSRLMERLRYLEDKKKRSVEFRKVRVKQTQDDIDEEIDGVQKAIDFVKGRMEEYMLSVNVTSLGVPGVGTAVIRKGRDASEIVQSGRVISHLKSIQSLCAHLAIPTYTHEAVPEIGDTGEEAAPPPGAEADAEKPPPEQAAEPEEGPSEAPREMWVASEASSDGIAVGACNLTSSDFLKSVGADRPDGEIFASECMLCPWKHHHRDPSLPEDQGGCPKFTSAIPEDLGALVKVSETVNKKALAEILDDPELTPFALFTRPAGAQPVIAQEVEGRDHVMSADIIDGACVGISGDGVVFLPPRKPRKKREDGGKAKGKSKKG